MDPGTGSHFYFSHNEIEIGDRSRARIKIDLWQGRSGVASGRSRLARRTFSGARAVAFENGIASVCDRAEHDSQRPADDDKRDEDERYEKSFHPLPPLALALLFRFELLKPDPAAQIDGLPRFFDVENALRDKFNGPLRQIVYRLFASGSGQRIDTLAFVQ